MIKITEKSIDVQKIIDTVSSLSAGALNVFIGTVRNNANGKNVLWLEYEAYETMAVAEIRKIIDDASHRWPLLGWAVTHRIGTLKPGETAVDVAVSTPHRKDSFEACQFIIDTVKANVPIWKKEVFENAYKEIINNDFEFVVRYPPKKAKDKKKVAEIIIEKKRGHSGSYEPNWDESWTHARERYDSCKVKGKKG